MITAIDERLRAEAERFALRFACEHCAHFDEPRAACANGYPAEPHREPDLRGRRQLTFCKEFELT